MASWPCQKLTVTSPLGSSASHFARGSDSSAVTLFVTGNASSLWTDIDVGSVGTAGNASFNGTTFTPGGTNTPPTHNLVVTDDFVYPEPVPLSNGVPPVSGTPGLSTAAATIAAQVGTPFTGTVATFSSNDPQATLPANYTFTAGDQGVHNFSATFRTAGASGDDFIHRP